LVLYISGLALLLLVAVAHFAYGYDYKPPLAAGAALWIAGYVAYMLREVYSYKAAKAAERACVLRRTAEIVVEIERIKTKLVKEIDELEQELKNRRIVSVSNI
jgi:hypothetical protein